MYHQYRSKVEAIQHINHGAKLFICPVLPTKSREYNQKAMFFNRLIFNDMVQCVFGITIVHGFGSFLGPDGVLSGKLAKPQLWDLLHINDIGVRKLAKLIKTSLFQRKRLRGSSIVSNRTYANAVQGHQPP